MYGGPLSAGPVQRGAMSGVGPAPALGPPAQRCRRGGRVVGREHPKIASIRRRHAPAYVTSPHVLGLLLVRIGWNCRASATLRRITTGVLHLAAVGTRPGAELKYHVDRSKAHTPRSAPHPVHFSLAASLALRKRARGEPAAATRTRTQGWAQAQARMKYLSRTADSTSAGHRPVASQGYVSGMTADLAQRPHRAQSELPNAQEPPTWARHRPFWPVWPHGARNAASPARGSMSAWRGRPGWPRRGSTCTWRSITSGRAVCPGQWAGGQTGRMRDRCGGVVRLLLGRCGFSAVAEMGGAQRAGVWAMWPPHVHRAAWRRPVPGSRALG